MQTREKKTETAAQVEAFPLCWPGNFPRSKSPSASKFGKHTVSEALNFCRDELQRINARNLVISSNVTLSSQSPKDPGVAVYFNLGQLRCALACDRWSTVAHNLWALGKHIEALRGQDRWGVGSIDQAFAGYAALPAPTGRDCWGVLGIKRQDATRERILEQYRSLVTLAHPDKPGGSHDKFRELTAAKDLALANLPTA